MSYLRIGAVAATTGILLLFGTTADAATTTASCSSSGHNNNASATYSTSGSYHVWGTAYYMLTGAGTGGKSNEIIRLRANGSDKWAWDSPDNRVNNKQYSQSMGGTKTLASQSEYMLFRAIFDTAGSDPACNAYTPTF